MAKRSTIGENPLDAVNQDHPLDTVVPDRSAAARAGRLLIPNPDNAAPKKHKLSKYKRLILMMIPPEKIVAYDWNINPR